MFLFQPFTTKSEVLTAPRMETLKPLLNKEEMLIARIFFLSQVLCPLEENPHHLHVTKSLICKCLQFQQQNILLSGKVHACNSLPHNQYF